jgi:hypothetical protein
MFACVAGGLTMYTQRMYSGPSDGNEEAADKNAEGKYPDEG